MTDTIQENDLPRLTHWLHSHPYTCDCPQAKLLREDIKARVADALAKTTLYKGKDMEQESSFAYENSIQSDFFTDYSPVPFPAPSNPLFTFVDLFAGIGGIRIPYDELGGDCIFSSEWDTKACETYFANFGVVPYGDITKIAASEIPAHDLLLAGFPCQAFSIMGKMLGFADTRGTMFFEIERILEHHHPPYIMLENVKQLIGHDKGRTFKVILEHLQELGYYVKWKVLNALDFGLPQKRERVIIVGFLNKEDYDTFNFEFTQKPYKLADILEDDNKVDKSLFASDHIISKRKEKTIGKNVFYPSIWHENKSGNISILDHSCALRTGASYNYLLVNGIRRPSSRELLRLQGFPDKYRIVVSHQDIRRQTGNSVATPMIRMVAEKIVRIIKKHKNETSETTRWKKDANQ